MQRECIASLFPYYFADRQDFGGRDETLSSGDSLVVLDAGRTGGSTESRELSRVAHAAGALGQAAASTTLARPRGRRQAASRSARRRSPDARKQQQCADSGGAGRNR